jgi:hypothetical protein
MACMPNHSVAAQAAKAVFPLLKKRPAHAVNADSSRPLE